MGCEKNRDSGSDENTQSIFHKIIRMFGKKFRDFWSLTHILLYESIYESQQWHMVKNYLIKSDHWITNLVTAKTFRECWFRQEPKERESWISVYLSVQHFVEFLSWTSVAGIERAKEWLKRWLREDSNGGLKKGSEGRLKRGLKRT